mmetsp:Transcript_38653/g.122865  ORF Transcript_38653/g.122865 Transcript_38653/m.122865 type:complete len:222 (+) Transcript_38653:1160-1825(+)
MRPLLKMGSWFAALVPWRVGCSLCEPEQCCRNRSCTLRSRGAGLSSKGPRKQCFRLERMLLPCSLRKAWRTSSKPPAQAPCGPGAWEGLESWVGSGGSPTAAAAAAAAASSSRSLACQAFAVESALSNAARHRDVLARARSSPGAPPRAAAAASLAESALSAARCHHSALPLAHCSLGASASKSQPAVHSATASAISWACARSLSAPSLLQSSANWQRLPL